MKVHAYTSSEAPPAYRWVAFIFMPAFRRGEDDDGNTVKVQAGDAPLPIYFRGATREAAVTRAENWWRSERAKEAAHEAAVAERREKARLKRLEKVG